VDEDVHVPAGGDAGATGIAAARVGHLASSIRTNACEVYAIPPIAKNAMDGAREFIARAKMH
jgi:hypothetical protein